MVEVVKLLSQQSDCWTFTCLWELAAPPGGSELWTTVEEGCTLDTEPPELTWGKQNQEQILKLLGWLIKWKTSEEIKLTKKGYGLSINVQLSLKTYIKNVLYLVTRRVQAVKVDWAELGGRDVMWLTLGHCSRARLTLGKHNICREKKWAIV